MRGLGIEESTGAWSRPFPPSSAFSLSHVAKSTMWNLPPARFKWVSLPTGGPVNSGHLGHMVTQGHQMKSAVLRWALWVGWRQRKKLPLLEGEFHRNALRSLPGVEAMRPRLCPAPPTMSFWDRAITGQGLLLPTTHTCVEDVLREHSTTSMLLAAYSQWPKLGRAHVPTDSG